MQQRLLIPFLLLVATTACAQPHPVGDVPGQDYRRRPNLLLIVLDDMGPDLLGAYRKLLLEERDKHFPGCAEDPDCNPVPAWTPNLDALAAEGMLFSRCWANPVCSPTRAQIMTGAHGFRNGLGSVISLKRNVIDARFGRAPLAWHLGAAGYRSAAVGKWHLQSNLRNYRWQLPTSRLLLTPQDNHRCAATEYVGGGFDYRAGSPGNLRSDGDPTDVHDYFNWIKNCNGLPSESGTYATTDSVDEAIALLDPGQAVPCATATDPNGDPNHHGADFDLVREGRPWFLYLAFNGAHGPWHYPPPELCPYPAGSDSASWAFCDDPRPVPGDPFVQVRQMVEALDMELGRLLEVVDLRETYVIVVGDNGTSNEVLSTRSRFPPPDCLDQRGKGSLYDSGVRVPLLVAGPGVPAGTRCDALVSAVDLFATLSELAGVPSTAPDSVSLVPYLRDPEHPPLRPTVYAERFRDNFDPICQSFPTQARYLRALANDRFKLIRVQHAEPGCLPVNRLELYEVGNDPFEERNLLFHPDKIDDPFVLAPASDEDYCALRCEMIRMGVDKEAPGESCNCCVGLDDLARALSQLGCIDDCEACTGDRDGDCDVDLADLAYVLSNYGSCE